MHLVQNILERSNRKNMALADHTGCIQQGEELPPFPDIIELNVGGQVYITRYPTLVSVPGSLLSEMFSQKNSRPLARDSKGRYFLDRDGFLFRYVLDYMRDQQLVLPDHFPERLRLQREAEFFRLPELVKILAPKVSKQNSIGDDAFQSDSEEQSPNVEVARNLASVSAALVAAAGNQSAMSDLRRSGFITIGYRGSYTLGRDSQTDAKFRRVARIMVCGKTSLAKEVFGDTLNDSRDPDRPPERYTSRYYLKFTFLEQAFDRLADAGFHMVACNSTGTCAFAHDQTDDKIWTSYTEYVFYRAAGCGPDIEAMPELLQSSTVIPDIEITDGMKEMDLKPELFTEEAHNSDSGNDLSSSSLDSQCSATISTDIPTIDILPTEVSNLTVKEECPPIVNTLDLNQSPMDYAEAEVTASDKDSVQKEVKENGTEDSPETPQDERQPNEERKTLEVELTKCIEEFRKIKIPVVFPNKKRNWQNELIRKYQL
ncbi:BTB/POZ domain-containing protein KCTD12 isoform X1 [Xenopus laevis]|uniref:BTB/POZ domain-containing protein KCTD12 isoform X1 n=3 Tax=Xenopus laevis TaxID=8355 RepID=A0A8J1LIJ4_XENLA|nr:BTB/POZ domain-containing protein KCTD12 isoform X1 [Xenopus laevis]